MIDIHHFFQIHIWKDDSPGTKYSLDQENIFAELSPWPAQAAEKARQIYFPGPANILARANHPSKRTEQDTILSTGRTVVFSLGDRGV